MRMSERLLMAAKSKVGPIPLTAMSARGMIEENNACHEMKKNTIFHLRIPHFSKDTKKVNGNKTQSLTVNPIKSLSGWNHILMSLVWPFPFANLWTVTQHSC